MKCDDTDDDADADDDSNSRTTIHRYSGIKREARSRYRDKER